MAYAALLILVAGPLILGLALAYGVIRNRKRSCREMRVGEAAAREEFLHPNTYDPQTFRDKLRFKRRGFIRRRR
jgi:hypothetical protein